MPGKSALPFKHGFAPNAANFVKNLVFHECSVPLTLYIETFVPVFIELLLFITFPLVDDIIRSAGESHTTGGARAGKRKHKHIRAARLPEPQTKAEHRARQGLKTVLTITQPLEKIGYTFLLYYGVERFFYNWSSLLHNFEFCGRPESSGPYQAHTNPIHTTSSGTTEHLFLPIVDQNRASWAASFRSVTVPFGHYSVTMEITYQSVAINEMKAQVGFVIPGALGDTTFWSDEVTIQPGGFGSCIIQKDIFIRFIAGGTIGFVRKSSPVPIGITIAAASVSVYNFTPGA